jgi:single stranded DNA-binding protein
MAKIVKTKNEASDSSVDINECRLQGEVASDVKMRETTNGNRVANFSVLTTQAVGERKVSQYTRCVAWNQEADLVTKLGKGDRVRVKGRIATRKWKAKEDDAKYEYMTEVVIEELDTNLPY